jgi:hypothetical protein
MSLFALPSEIFQQVLSHTVEFENFAGLRLVHPHFNSTIRASAEDLMRNIILSHNISGRVLRLYQQADEPNVDMVFTDQKLSSLLRLHKNMATCVLLGAVLEAHRDKFSQFPIWSDVPAQSFNHIEPVLVFSAFQYELVRSVEAQAESKSSTMIARAKFNNNFDWLKLSQRFMHFVRDQLTVDDLEALMIIANFCAISTRFVDTILTSRCEFNDAGATGHWQNEQLGSALLTECILWGGPSWLAKSLHESILPTVSVQRQSKIPVGNHNTIWTGSRGNAARLTANGIARFLWKERARKLELERHLNEASETKTNAIRPDLKVDAAVWRGSSGG